MAVTLCSRSISSLEISVNLLNLGMKYVLIFYLLAPALGYTAGINKVADTLAVKLTSLVASLRILN